MPKAKKRGKLSHDVVWLDPDECVDNWWNPNSETAEKFNALFDSIQDMGMLETIQVVPIGEELLDAFSKSEDQDRLKELMGTGYRWLVLHGSHRFEAARLAGKEALPEIPAVVLQPADVGKLKALSVRMNIIRGEIDAERFIKLYDELVESDPEGGKQAVNAMLGITSQKELDALIKETKKSLPPEMQEALEAAKEEIKSIDDLSRVLNTLFTRYGEDLHYGFMTFTWGGKIHTMIQLTKDTNQMLAQVKQFCREQNADMNHVLTFAFRHVLGADQQQWPEPLDRDLSIAE